MKSALLERDAGNLDQEEDLLAQARKEYPQFDKLWMTEKPNIMQFNEMRDKYEHVLKTKLADVNVRLGLQSNGSDLVEQEC